MSISRAAVLSASPDLIHKEVLRDKIRAVLREWILRGELAPGERIVESTLARRLGVSRAPMREALWLLAGEGLVRIEAHRGTFVTRLSTRDLREIFDIRVALELQAARAIRANLDDDKRGQLSSALQDLREAARARDLQRFNDADQAFHRKVWQLSGNRHLEEVLGDLSARHFSYGLIRDLPHEDRYRYGDVLAEHERLVELINAASDSELEAGFRAVFARFLDYVLERYGGRDEGEDARA